MPLYILPVSHIAPESRLRAREAFEQTNPEILAVELDPARLSALLASASGAKPRPFFSLSRLRESLLALILSGIQNFFAGKLSEKPGEEFLVALRLAAAQGVPVALVDRDISITLSRLSSELRIGTVAKLLWFALFSRKGRIEFDISKIPEEKMIRKILFQLRREFPGIYRAIVSERDLVISENLKKIPEEKRTLLLVGAAHLPGLKRKLPKAIFL